jgi:RHS repeat-associated protein
VTTACWTTGRDFDSETELLNLRARYLDSSVGQFLTEDPIRFKGGNDFYAYVQNSPVTSVDPFGLQTRPSQPRPCTNVQAWNCAVKCGGWDKVLSCQVPRAWSFLRAKQGLILWGYIEGLPDCRCKPGAPPECHKVNQPDPKAVDDLKKFMVVVGIGTGVALAPEMEPLLVPETSLVPLCDCAMTRRLRIKL